MTAAWKLNKTVGGVLALFAFIYTTVVFSVVIVLTSVHQHRAKQILRLRVATDCAVAELLRPRREQLACADSQHHCGPWVLCCMCFG